MSARRMRAQRAERTHPEGDGRNTVTPFRTTWWCLWVRSKLQNRRLFPRNRGYPIGVIPETWIRLKPPLIGIPFNWALFFKHQVLTFQLLSLQVAIAAWTDTTAADWDEHKRNAYATRRVNASRIRRSEQDRSASNVLLICSPRSIKMDLRFGQFSHRMPCNNGYSAAKNRVKRSQNRLFFIRLSGHSIAARLNPAP
jgi:hypothetical protein